MKRVPIQIRVPIISDKQDCCPYEKPFGYIYKITNKINGHYYIGQHEFHHPWLDKKYKGSGSALWLAYKKYGIENFDTIILEWVCNIDELNNSEIYWIDIFGAYEYSFHYNLTIGGEHGPSMCGEDNPRSGVVLTDITKQLISIHRAGKCMGKDNPNYQGKAMNPELYDRYRHEYKGKHFSPKTEFTTETTLGSKNYASRRVRCVETEEEFDCMKDAYIFLGFKPEETRGHSDISAVCRGKQKTAYGYHWEYVD